MEKTVHFTIDPYFALNQLCCIYHEKNVNGNAEYSNAFKFTMSDLLYQGDKKLRPEEWNQIIETYQERHNLTGTFTIDVQPELREELYQIIQEQKRFKDIELDYILCGFGSHKNLVYDKRTGKTYPSSYAHHSSTLFEILKKEYDDEFGAMSQDEKDNFIMNNFIFVGASYSPDWYIPDGLFFGNPDSDSCSMSVKRDHRRGHRI